MAKLSRCSWLGKRSMAASSQFVRSVREQREEFANRDHMY